VTEHLSTHECPACAQAQSPLARYCSECGTPLIMRCPGCVAINVRTRAVCQRCGTRLEAASSVDADLTADAITVPTEVPEWPRLDDALSDGGPDEPRTTVEGSGTNPPSAAVQDVGGDDVRRRQKAERRAALRRARDRRAAAPNSRDVLVLEADASARALLCRWLELFGFRPALAVSVPEAEGLSLRQPHTAAFLGIGADTDGQATADFCQRLHRARQGRPLALIAVLDADAHADRVRLQLAGADAIVLRPVGRGDVARALESCGLALPDDPREGRAPAAAIDD
jgi:CheY-like chemotaxis protein